MNGCLRVGWSEASSAPFKKICKSIEKNWKHLWRHKIRKDLIRNIEKKIGGWMIKNKEWKQETKEQQQI